MVATVPNAGQLLPEHVAELAASGISREFALANGVYSERDHGRASKLLASKIDPKHLPALVFPYLEAGGDVLFRRVKFKTPRLNQKGKAKKYEQPPKNPLRLYLPQCVRPFLLDATQPLVVTEGEKKTLSLNAHGVPTIGLAGVSAWNEPQKVKLRGDFTQIALARRVFYLLFDSDAAHDDNVRRQEYHLALSLIEQGAEVRIVRLPGGPIGPDGSPGKVGADDYLVAHGVESLQALLAGSPIATIPDEARATWEAKKDDRPHLKNFVSIAGEGADEKPIAIPLPIARVLAALEAMPTGRPLRCGPSVFVHDPARDIAFLPKADALFGYLHRQFHVDWKGGSDFVSKAELYEELRRTAPDCDAIERLPHFPPMPRTYYACATPAPGSGETLRELVNRFTPSTTIDRDLILAMIATTFWGGRPGSRPAFVVTSNAGRGAGKTTLAKVIGKLGGGYMAVEPGEDITKMKQRFLSPDAVGKRIALIDNVKRTRFSWGELEALITATTISGDKKYVGESQRQNTLTWIVTLNGVALSTDLAQRAVVVMLDQAPYSGTWEDETFRLIEAKRDALLADVAAFFDGDRFPLEKSSRWGDWEREILERLPEPGEAQRVILERQAECDADGDDGDMIDEYVGEQLSRYGYDPSRDQVRIRNAILARWFVEATGEPMKTTAVTRRLKQMAQEGQLKRLSSDPSRSHGRCFIYTGPNADRLLNPIDNELDFRLRSNYGAA